MSQRSTPAAHEDAFDAGRPLGVGRDRPPRPDLGAQLGDGAPALRPEEAHGQQHQLALELELRTGYDDEDGPAVFHPLLDGVAPQSAHGPCPVVDERGGRHREQALPTLLVGRGRPQDERPQGPRVVGQSVARGLDHDLELVYRRGVLAVGRAQAVRAGVAAADDDDPLALGADG